VWRDAMTFGASSLANRGPGLSGPVDENDFLFWRAHFGDTLGSGSGAESPSAEAAVATEAEQTAAVESEPTIAVPSGPPGVVSAERPPPTDQLAEGFARSPAETAPSADPDVDYAVTQTEPSPDENLDVAFTLPAAQRRGRAAAHSLVLAKRSVIDDDADASLLLLAHSTVKDRARRARAGDALADRCKENSDRNDKALSSSLDTVFAEWPSHIKNRTRLSQSR
jgi:hypothetical protein